MICAPTPASEELRQLARDALVGDEGQRADNAGTEQRRDELILGRGLLRLTLRHLNSENATAPITLGKRGAPVFGGSNAPRFSISHAPGLVMVAISTHGALGVDVDMRGRKLSVTRLARRVLDEVELAYFQALDEPAQSLALIDAWVGKEAVLKALGTGVNGVTRTVRVLGDNGVVSHQDAAGDRHRWYVSWLPLHERWRACVTSPNRPRLVRLQVVPSNANNEVLNIKAM